jgi:hypothetical protein
MLRAHHLICLLGFRGLGYSPEFLQDMTKIVFELLSCPETLIEVVYGPDDICTPCPFLKDGGCHEEGTHSEEITKKRDRAVMMRLGLVSGEKVTWYAVEQRIRSSISLQDLEQICQDCRWLPLGYCVAGLERLRE